MENLGRQNFEESWRDLFSGAEGPSPSDSVWLVIDGALTAAENNANKGRVVFYQRLAASLLLLTTLSAMITYWRWNERSSLEIATETTTNQAATDADQSSANITKEKLYDGNNPGGKKGNAAFLSEDASATTRNSKGKGNTSSVDNDYPVPRAEFMVAQSDPDGNEFMPSDSTSADAEIVSNAAEIKKQLTPEEEQELVAKLKDQIEETIIPEKKSGRRNRWLAVGASGGSFAPQATTGAGPAALFDQVSNASSYNKTPAVLKKPSTGSSFSFGITAGKQLSRKWLVQTGFTYWKQRMDFQSDITEMTGNQASAFSTDYATTGSAKIAFTSPYDVSSTAEFISIPIQAGYVLVDRKIGWILNAGISSDIFLNNTLADRSGQYGAYSQSGSDSKLYRRLSWSAMAGTEVNLRLGERYRIAFVPGIRYSFTNIYNAESGTSNPLVFDIGLRFRYIFK